jgi:predicted amidohydrolase
MNKSMRIAPVHLDVHYKKPETNRGNLFRLNREGALKGADVILNTELPVIGYSFNSREEISEYIENDHGLTVTGLAEIARERSKYIGIGLAEQDDATGIFYNGAIMIGPDGRQISRYRKINAEMRWACPGDSKQENTFDTPWGRIAILICSDTYYGLFAGSMALKGVDLLWTPANWRPAGIDVEEVLNARVLENGFFLAACNRTGKDRIMDCSDAVSCVYVLEGRELFSASLSQSCVFLADLPLDEKGKLRGVLRREKLKDRTPHYYASIYPDLRLVENLTEHHGLPEPVPLRVHCIVPPENHLEIGALERMIPDIKGNGHDLFVLPPFPMTDRAALHSMAERNKVGLCAAVIGNGNVRIHTMWTADGEHTGISPDKYDRRDRFPFPMMHYGPAKLAMAPLDCFAHPELAVAFAKLGCDLVVLSEEKLSEESRLLGEIKTIQGVAVAVCASNGGLVAMTPIGHNGWEERSIKGPGVCSYEIDIARTRKKSFEDRLDFELLLKRPAKH